MLDIAAVSLGLLAILWEMFPSHPNLLEAHLQSPCGLPSYVRMPPKPLTSAIHAPASEARWMDFRITSAT